MLSHGWPSAAILGLMRGQMQLYKAGAKGGGQAVARYLAGDEEQLGRYLNHGDDFPMDLHMTWNPAVSDDPTDSMRITTEQFERLWDGQNIDGDTLKAFTRDCETRMIEIPLNDNKDLDVAGVEYEDVRTAREHARARAIDAVNTYLAGSVVARVKGEDGRYVATGVDQIMTVAASHPTSRAGDPMYHTHLMLVNRVQVDGEWKSIWAKQLLGDYENVRSTYELAMYSDPELVAALQRHGLSMDGHGEIAELHITDEATGEITSASDVFSKRHDQIVERYAELLDQWRENHGNERATLHDVTGRVIGAAGYDDKTEPDARTRSALMRQAWADTRPAKTSLNAFARWEDWRDELHAAGWNLREMLPPSHRAAARPDITTIPDSSCRLAALNAVTVLQDQKSAWSRRDLEAECRHQVQAWNAVGRTEDIDVAVAVVIDEALGLCGTLSDDPRAALPWAKSLTTEHVIETDADLHADLDRLAARIAPRDEQREQQIEATADRMGLDQDQRAAAREIATGGGLTVVEGVAGAGKTTMLKAVKETTDAAGETLVVVSPTNKGAITARDEIGAGTSSVAKLLWDAGWRQQEHGGWRKLQIGETDEGGYVWRGQRTGVRLDAATRLVVDEAGMLDVDTARALAAECADKGTHLTLMGDRSQLPQVGRGGVLDMATAAAGPHVVHMRTSHRFADPEYTALMLDLHDRTPQTAGDLAQRIQDRGMIRVSDDAARQIADMYVNGDRNVVISTDTNEQAAEINTLVQHKRQERSEVEGGNAPHIRGLDGNLYQGDRIMVRVNDARRGLYNRETYTITALRADNGRLVADLTDDRHQRRTVAAEALQDRAQLGYASTVYGAQGVTAARSIYWAGAGSDGHSLYTALSRGKAENTVWIDADADETPAETLTRIISRDNGDRGLSAAREALQAQIDSEGVRTPATPGHNPEQPQPATEPTWEPEPEEMPNPMAWNPTLNPMDLPMPTPGAPTGPTAPYTGPELH